MKFKVKRTVEIKMEDTQEFSQDEIRGIQMRHHTGTLSEFDHKVISAILSSICLKLNEP